MSIMGRIKGAAQEVSGKVKQAAGRPANEPELGQKGPEQGGNGAGAAGIPWPGGVAGVAKGVSARRRRGGRARWSGTSAWR